MSRFVSSYFWVVVLVVLGLNYGMSHRAVRTRSGLSAKTNQEIESYFRFYWGGMALPWLIVGAGCWSGATPSIWYYFRPQDENPFVVAWLASVFIEAVIYALWVFFAGGASIASQASRLLAEGRSRVVGQSELVVKLVAIATVFMCPAWIYVAVRMNAPLPKW